MKTRFIVIASCLLGMLLSSCSQQATLTPTVVDNVANAATLVSEANFEAAFSLYNQDIQNNRDLARAYAGRGNIYLSWRRFDEAISDFTAALGLVRTPEVLIGRCIAYRLLSKFKQADADCKEALQLNPALVDGYIATALLQSEEKNNTDALTTIQEGINKNPNSDAAYFALSQIQLSKGDVFASIDALTKSVELQPKNAQYYCERGFLFYSTAQLDKAKQDYKKALELGINGKDDDCIYKASGMLKMLGN